MKKTYTKPDIMFDCFSISESIAACGVQANFQRGTCGVVFTESIILFNEGVTQCNWFVEEGEYNGICYHVPIDSNSVFGS